MVFIIYPQVYFGIYPGVDSGPGYKMKGGVIWGLTPAIAKFISDNDTDPFAMSKTMIRPETTGANLSEITPPGHNLYQQPREVCRGGGLGFFVKDA